MLQMPKNFKHDDRPQKGAWAPGNYFCLCVECGGQFIGDKRAHECADCAYSPDPPKPELVHHICAWLIEKFSRAWKS